MESFGVIYRRAAKSTSVERIVPYIFDFYWLFLLKPVKWDCEQRLVKERSEVFGLRLPHQLLDGVHWRRLCTSF